jgi:cytochrome P450
MLAPFAEEAFRADYFDKVHEFFATMRAKAPVHRAVMPDGLPVWVITHYADVRAALVDGRLRKNRRHMIEIVTGKLAESGLSTDLSALYTPHMLLTDPPDHTRLRTLLANAFTARRVEALRPRIDQIATILLDALPGTGAVDLVAGFAEPLPATVIAELLGVPETDRPQFQRWASDMIGHQPEVTMAASAQLVPYIGELIATKAARPDDGLISALVAATEDGQRLDAEELLATTLLLLIAGHETTANLIGNAIPYLLTNPTLAAQLREQPQRIRPAIEELLRIDSPVMMSTPRYSAEGITVGDVTIPAGEIVLMSLGSANRDEDRFADADQIHLDREERGHVAFGHGIHYCIGAPLARLEGEIALGHLLRRFPNARLAVPADQLTRRVASVMNGWAQLPVHLAHAGEAPSG